MPKKKQVIFQTSIPGKFIPRDDPLPGSVFRSKANDNRFNARMAELFASSSDVHTNEHQLVSTPISQDTQVTNAESEVTSIESTNLHSNLLHRRIVTMLETLKTSTNDDAPATTTTTTTTSQFENKSQPITFGQLRQATINDEKSNPQSTIIDRTDKHLQTWNTVKRESCPDLTSTMKKSQTNKERLYTAPSFERVHQESNMNSQTKTESEQSQQSSLTVDEILAMYYSKANQSINHESHLSSPNYANTSTGFYAHSTQTRWATSVNNLHNIPSNSTSVQPRIILQEQNRTRPPPPSYSSSISQSHRTISIQNQAQHQINPHVLPPILEHLYPNTYSPSHLLTDNSHSNPSPSFVPPIANSATNTTIRPPPPRYVSPSTDSDRSSTILSTINDSTSSSQQTKPSSSPPPATKTGYDREFSRLLYGKDAMKIRRQKQKRKAFSDPVKKSVEEASRFMEKANRRVTTHLNRTDTLKEEAEADNDDTGSDDRSNVENKDQDLLPRRRFQRQSDLIDKNRESAQKAIIPANPLLKRRIPSFLRVYSQAPSSNDILLQWHLFNLSELESFYAMMTRLYKNENLARVQLYEIYRTALLSALAAKTVRISTTNSDNESITTPL